MKNAGKPSFELWIAFALTLLWLIGIGFYFTSVPGSAAIMLLDIPTALIALLSGLLPIVLLWTIALVAVALKAMRAESTALRVALDGVHDVIRSQVAKSSDERDVWIDTQLAEISNLTQLTDNRLTELANRSYRERGETPPASPDITLGGGQAEPPDREAQTELQFAEIPAPNADPITIREFIKAVNFPENAEDNEGFRILKLAFQDHQTGKLIQAAQDILTLFSQSGIYMDDLKMSPPKPALWRNFANGVRGPSISGLGGITSERSLAQTRRRLKNDTVFRDTAHHFMRRFDKTLTIFARDAADTDLVDLAQTRSGCAFMLLGRATGAFD